tara:strand:- start:3623 stop:4717 length:1095 start_codon:yes stop_codon:yes gene_type:complete
MRILYDGWIYGKQPLGGVSRYFNNIISRLPPEWFSFLVTKNCEALQPPDHSRLQHYKFRGGSGPVGKWPELRDRLAWFRQKRLLAPDLVHLTYYMPIGSRKISSYRVPIVVTVFDLIHELVLHAGKDTDIMRAKREAIDQAEAVICISENTRRDLLRVYQCDETKVHAIPLASSLELRPRSCSATNEIDPYLIYVGTRWPYKNFPRALEAFATVRNDGLKIDLVVVGPDFSADELDHLGRLGVHSCVRNVGYVSDEVLGDLYEGAVALIYPSTYEGFGLPLLEAMACGTAIIAAKTSSIPEVVGKAGVLFDPYSVDELCYAIATVVDDVAFRNQLITEGRKQVKKFSWDRTVQETIRVYAAIGV